MKNSSKKSIRCNNSYPTTLAKFQNLTINTNQLSQIKGGADIIIIEDVVEG